jgi:hypothetical protein
MHVRIAWGGVCRDVLVPLDEADPIPWLHILGVGERGRNKEQEHQHTHRAAHGCPPSYHQGFWGVFLRNEQEAAVLARSCRDASLWASVRRVAPKS